MKWIAALSLAALLGGASDGGPAPTAGPEDRLYGRVTTAGGMVIEGWLRWGSNEGSWADFLNADKEIPWDHLREAERLDEEYGRRRARERSIRFMGVRITWDEDDDESTLSSAGLRFGHISSLRVLDDRRASILLKSGDEVELSGGWNDVGDGMGRLSVLSSDGEETRLRWRDLERVEFLEPPGSGPAPVGQRLWGTLTTVGGMEFTGFIAWDADEILSEDVLDGERDGKEVEIVFERIRSIEPDGRRAAIVVLEDGEELHLRGSNDVNNDNRGITVSDPALGQINVDWEDLRIVEFRPTPEGHGGRYTDFDGGRRLHGVVVTTDGREIEGNIRWDNDESFTWEVLDGSIDEADLDIEFGRVDRIERLGGWGVEVTLRDGRTFDLDGSNDVDDENRGLFIETAPGATVLVRWEELAQVTFTR